MKSFEETKSEIIEFLNDGRFANIFNSRSAYLKEKINDIFYDIEFV